MLLDCLPACLVTELLLGCSPGAALATETSPAAHFLVSGEAEAGLAAGRGGGGGRVTSSRCSCGPVDTRLHVERHRASIVQFLLDCTDADN